MTIRIGADYGHNGPSIDPGAVGPAGTLESTRAFEIGRRFKDIAEGRGYIVVEARSALDEIGLPETNDQVGDMPARVAIFNESGCDVVLSFHCNAASSEEAEGIEVFTSLGETDADSLASKILAKLEAAFPDHAIRADYADGDADKEANFYMIRKPDAPAVLIETEFISNPTMELKLGDPVWQQCFAQAVFDGLEAWLAERGA